MIISDRRANGPGRAHVEGELVIVKTQDRGHVGELVLVRGTPRCPMAVDLRKAGILLSHGVIDYRKAPPLKVNRNNRAI